MVEVELPVFMLGGSEESRIYMSSQIEDIENIEPELAGG